MREVFEVTKMEEYEIADVLGVGKDPQGSSEFLVHIAWRRLDKAEVSGIRYQSSTLILPSIWCKNRRKYASRGGYGQC